MFDFICTIKDDDKKDPPADFKYKVVTDDMAHYFGYKTIDRDLVKLFGKHSVLVEESPGTYIAYPNDQVPDNVDPKKILV